ncbi:Rcp protein, confers resistance to cationic antimicrobial peptides and promotes intracellular infection [Legionella donaldsonii]|uniref:Rcp protein, confers resistance to cationic antimicrobial peptides and promotes intracellular infection n=1 Tax=Legionella donaldsonii TaxID=45060 RepID=A0A378IYV6_9GAMM|nr:lipid IV(A) palmitoyltransferase PagP [Legionella donaldsonii]STX40288.1 Rcp protein, confers resistance to cationic antimicrobial peptides and promotes intracellular infection [Legionella donaldsonii]
MKKIFIGLLLLMMTNIVRAENDATCSTWHAWFKPVCISHRLKQIWTEGNNELYLTGYAWHNRYTYPPEKIKTYNELAWGGGLGKGLYDENGDWHGLYAFAFLDSHKNVEPVAGYAFLKVAHLSDNMRVGAGVAALVTARPDLNKGIPFPGVLPWLSFNYRQATLSATYIPGMSKRNGNVLFLLGKWTFDLM